MNLYPTIDEFECPRYKCKDCIHFKARLPSNDYKGCTYRFDHSKMEYAHSWFVSCPEDYGPICSDFEPNGLYKAALPYWHGIAHYLEWRKRQDAELQGGEYHEKEVRIGFEISSHPEERYYVKFDDYFYGKMWEGDKLKAFMKKYYRRTKRGFGYELVTENIDGVIVGGASAKNE